MAAKTGKNLEQGKEILAIKTEKSTVVCQKEIGVYESLLKLHNLRSQLSFMITNQLKKPITAQHG